MKCSRCDLMACDHSVTVTLTIPTNEARELTWDAGRRVLDPPALDMRVRAVARLTAALVDAEVVA